MTMEYINYFSGVIHNLQRNPQHQGLPSLQELLGLQQHPSHRCDQQVQYHHGFL